jgi:hypothetical protein
VVRIPVGPARYELWEYLVRADERNALNADCWLRF